MTLDLQNYTVRTDLAIDSKEMAQGGQKQTIPGLREDVEKKRALRLHVLMYLMMKQPQPLVG